MAMLSEPRKRSKYSVNPRGTAWSNDENKFGQKLMEKMGWQKGKGLGANEDGKTENVKIALKNDAKGVGCSNSYADKWIAHQDDFNDLLANLNQNHVAGGDNPDTNTSVTVSSLEKKSKSSKARVHYQKFTKGKDLSLKTATDLDCVFGKRKAVPDNGTGTPQSKSEANSDAPDVESGDSGMKTVNSTDSIQEYFARKMKERTSKLAKRSPLCRSGGQSFIGATETEDEDVKTVSFSIGGVDSLAVSNESSDDGMGTEPVEKHIQRDGNTNLMQFNDVKDTSVNADCSVGKSKKKKNKKKSKKNKVEDSVNEVKESVEVAVENSRIGDNEHVKKKSKKHKKDKHSCKDSVQSDNPQVDNEAKLKTIIKGNKCSRVKNESKVKRVSFHLENETSNKEETPVKKKAKIRKHKERNEEQSCNDSLDSSETTGSHSKETDTNKTDLIKKLKVEKTNTVNEGPVTNNVGKGIETGSSVDKSVINNCDKITKNKKRTRMSFYKKTKKNMKAAGLVAGKMDYNFDPIVSPVVNKNSDAFTGSNLSKVRGYDGLTDTVVINGLLRPRLNKRKAKW